MAHRFLYPPTLDVSFVIATFNRGQTLIDCLRRTLACGLPASHFEILVVDNASTDGTRELLASALPQVRLTRSQKNLGPVAKNLAIAQSRGNIIVLLDDDAYPTGDAIERMLQHFQSDPTLGAAMFDVALPDGTREASAYGSVFIGAGTALRRTALEQVGFLPPDFFMQAEEYDLSFRLLDAGFSIRRFADLPLTHLKSPGARIAHRTTRLDVRNNLYLLAKYIPAPLCHTLAGEWLSRYWLMAASRDRAAGTVIHRRAFMQGAGEGLQRWPAQRRAGKRLKPETIERVFQFAGIRKRLATAVGSVRRIVLVDFGKNIYPYWLAAQELQLEILAVADDHLTGPHAAYRDIPVLPTLGALALHPEALLFTHMSPIHLQRRMASITVKSTMRLLNLLATEL